LWTQSAGFETRFFSSNSASPFQRRCWRRLSSHISYLESLYGVGRGLFFWTLFPAFVADGSVSSSSGLASDCLVHGLRGVVAPFGCHASPVLFSFAVKEHEVPCLDPMVHRGLHFLPWSTADFSLRKTTTDFAGGPFKWRPRGPPQDHGYCFLTSREGWARLRRLALGLPRSRSGLRAMSPHLLRQTNNFRTTLVVVINLEWSCPRSVYLGIYLFSQAALSFLRIGDRFAFMMLTPSLTAGELITFGFPCIQTVLFASYCVGPFPSLPRSV